MPEGRRARNITPLQRGRDILNRSSDHADTNLLKTMIPPEVAFDRFLQEKHVPSEQKYVHIVGRVAVEDLPPNHLYRWSVNCINQQLSNNIGVNSTAGVTLPPLHFELVRVH